MATSQLDRRTRSRVVKWARIANQWTICTAIARATMPIAVSRGLPAKLGLERARAASAHAIMYATTYTIRPIGCVRRRPTDHRITGYCAIGARANASPRLIGQLLKALASSGANSGSRRAASGNRPIMSSTVPATTQNRAASMSVPA